MKEEEELYCLRSENKGADQLHSYCEADLRLCFCIGKYHQAALCSNASNCSNVLSLQGDLRYKLEGFKPGTDLFEVDPVTAEVKTIGSLNNDERSYLVGNLLIFFLQNIMSA